MITYQSKTTKTFDTQCVKYSEYTAKTIKKTKKIFLYPLNLVALQHFLK